MRHFFRKSGKVDLFAIVFFLGLLLFCWPYLNRDILGDIGNTFFYFFSVWAIIIALILLMIFPKQ